MTEEPCFTESDTTEATKQHTWDEWQASSYSCSFSLSPVLSLITYLVLLQFKNDCLLSDSSCNMLNR